jgi:hypothetical protein
MLDNKFSRTFCVGKNCHVKEQCLRNVARHIGSQLTANQWTAAFWQTAGFTPEHGCEYREPLPATGTDGYALRGDHETAR